MVAGAALGRVGCHGTRGTEDERGDGACAGHGVEIGLTNGVTNRGGSGAASVARVYGDVPTALLAPP